MNSSQQSKSERSKLSSLHHSITPSLHHSITPSLHHLLGVAILPGMGLFQIGGQQLDCALDILYMRHLIDGMDITGGYGESETRHAATAALNSSCIRAAAGQDLQLVGDSLCLRNVPEMTDQFRMAHQGGVTDLDGAAFA